MLMNFCEGCVCVNQCGNVEKWTQMRSWDNPELTHLSIAILHKMQKFRLVFSGSVCFPQKTLWSNAHGSNGNPPGKLHWALVFAPQNTVNKHSVGPVFYYRTRINMSYCWRVTDGLQAAQNWGRHGILLMAPLTLRIQETKQNSSGSDVSGCP